MPKEIEERPRPRDIELRNIRITFEELVSLLERLNLDVDQIHATSNGAEFQGLADIKSAPARFSGEPFIQVKSNPENDGQACASVEFGAVKTCVSAGWWKGEIEQKLDDDALAIKISEELKPFQSIWLNRLERHMPINWRFFFMGATFWVLSMFLFQEVLSLVGSLLVFISSVIFLIVTISREFWDKKTPISFNPRKTFWQRHGEASVVGAMMTIITSLFMWYITG